MNIRNIHRPKTEEDEYAFWPVLNKMTNRLKAYKKARFRRARCRKCRYYDDMERKYMKAF